MAPEQVVLDLVIREYSPGLRLFRANDLATKSVHTFFQRDHLSRTIHAAFATTTGISASKSASALALLNGATKADVTYLMVSHRNICRRPCFHWRAIGPRQLVAIGRINTLFHILCHLCLVGSGSSFPRWLIPLRRRL